MKKILVPTDFSLPATWALEIAHSIAQKANAEIVLLHVVEQPSTESFNVEGQFSNPFDLEDKVFIHKLLQKSRTQLMETANKIEGRGIEVIPLLRLGNPYHGIRTIITEYNADLIVMGTSGRSAFEEILIGSNAEKVVRHAKCPVLTVHHKISSASFKNIVFATSMNEEEGPFIKTLQEVQSIFGSKIHILRINTPLNFRSDTEVKRVMKAFVSKYQLSNCTLNVFNAHNEERGIAQFASGIGADLIAMATHGRTSVAHVIVGSIAEDVVSHSTQPVLTCLV